MHDEMKSRKRILTGAVAVAVAAAGAFMFAQRNDFGLGRNMELLVNMMRELSVNYVDPVSADDLMANAADGMVRNLDPYTVYLSEEDMKNFEVSATGKYGGVGAIISKRGDWVVIREPYKDSPADRAGLKAGDRIVAIDGTDTKGFSTEDVSSRLKGDPNTYVKVTVERNVDGERVTHNIRRERIAISGITYSGWAADGVGIISHADFSEGCYDDMRAAIERLRSEGELRGLILDYRNNGGGSLPEAIKIVSLFVPKGTEVVSMKGRAAESNRTYKTPYEPLLPDTPLAVLINSNTASSSEIVSGSLQDLDRAVLLGSKSFGKGLVQTTIPIGYDAYVKMTTAKYYIPSGRCIQNIDYSSHDDNIREVPDSLVREFTTRSGRKVYDGGGLMPDVRIEPEYISRFALTIYAMGFIDEFCDDYVRLHPDLKPDNRTFKLADEDYAAFEEFMKDKEVPYTSETRRVLERLCKAVDADKYADRYGEMIATMESQLDDDTPSNLRTYRKEIAESIEAGIVTRYNYSHGAAERGLARDNAVAEAVKILDNPEEYARILAEQDTPRK